MFNFFKQHWTKILSGFLFVFLLSAYVRIFAIATPYDPGETLDPACEPGETNCTVEFLANPVAGSVIFSNGTDFTQDNTNFFWDDTNNRLGIGTATPVTSLDVKKTNIEDAYGAVQAVNDITNPTSTYRAYLGMFADSIVRQDTGVDSLTGSSSTGLAGYADDYLSSVDQASFGLVGLDFRTRHYGTKLIGTATGVSTLNQTRAAGNITNSYNFLARGVQKTSTGVVTGNHIGFYSSNEFVTGISDTNNYYHFYGSGNYKSYFGGNVGIGTTAPAGKVHIVGPALAIDNETTYGVRISESGDETEGLLLGYDKATGYGIVTAVDQGITWKGLLLNPNGGNVGIGTTNPGQKLEVNGSILIPNNAGYYMTKSAAGNAVAALYTDSSDITRVGPNYDGSKTVIRSDAGDVVMVDNLGSVGIGTTSPSQLLHVAGNARITGALYDSSNSAGSSGYVLTSTGSGTGWNTISGAIGSTAFIQNGNSFGALATLGTNDNYGLAFETNGSEKVRIDTNGYVGIGTTSPGNKLSLYGDGGASYTNFGLSINNTNTGATAHASIDFLTGVSATKWQIFSRNSQFIIGRATVRDDAVFLSNGDMSITGNVGIGTTSPVSKLQVYGDANNSLFFQGITASNPNPIIAAQTANTGSEYLGFAVRAGTTPAALTDSAGADVRMVITKLGNVGIGTTNPFGKLEVAGQYVGFQSTDYSDGVQGNRLRFNIPTLASTYTELQSYKIGSTAYGNLALNPNGGNVGIGTTAPSMKLHTQINDGTIINATNINNNTIDGIRLTNLSSGNQTGSVLLLEGNAGGSKAGIAQIQQGDSTNTSDLAFYTQNAGTFAEAMRILGASGNVGIGTTSPGAKLDVLGVAGYNSASFGPTRTYKEAYLYSSVYIENSNYTTGQALAVSGYPSSTTSINPLALIEGRYEMTTAPSTILLRVKPYDNASAGLTVQNSGNVGIGTTTPSDKLVVEANSWMAETISSYSASGSYGSLNFRKNYSNDPNVNVAPPSGQTLGRIIFSGYDTSSYTDGAFIRGITTEAWSSTALGTKITFGTTANGTTSRLERMVIDQSGYVGIAMTNPSVALDVTGDIEYTGTITDVSDERLKENITPITGALDMVMNIEAKYFNMKDTPDRVETGFIAQNVKEYLPSAVSIVDPENGYYGVAYSNLIPVSFGAIKELNLKINDLTILTETETENWTFGSLIKKFFENVENGIVDLYTKIIHTRTLCVADESGAETCITKDQLDQLLLNADLDNSSSSSDSSSSSSSDSSNDESSDGTEDLTEGEEDLEEGNLDEETSTEDTVTEPPAEETVSEESTTEEDTTQENSVEVPTETPTE